MKTILSLDLKSYCKNWQFLVLVIALFIFGIFGGINARFTISQNLAYNSPYQIAFITAFLSLTSIFFVTLFSAQMSLKEFDCNLHLIYFSLPISKQQFLWSRFISIFILSFSFTLLLTISFFIGREFSSSGIQFNFLFYLYPIIIFTIINTLLVVAITTFVGWFTKSKLYIYVSGLLLYILYMACLLFSNSPFMANQLPQSKQAQLLSATIDPFGLSAFFFQTSNLSIPQRNTELLAINGIFLANRIGIVLIAIVLLILITKKSSISKRIKLSKVKQTQYKPASNQHFKFVPTEKSTKVKLQSLFSFTKTNWIYVVKSIPFILITISLLFAIGMEMYAEIEKGIRLPQRYASSGLMVSTIIQNFYVLGALILAFYANDLYWRSKNSNFHYIEESTGNFTIKFWSIWITLTVLAFTFTTILIVEGIVFQLLYNYPTIQWKVYTKTILLTTLPLIAVSGFTLCIQKIIKNKYLSIAISGIFILLMTTTLGKTVIKHPLLKFLHTIPFDYSDMNGFGTYENAFLQRLLFGYLLLLFLVYLIHQNKKSIAKASFIIITLSSISIIYIIGNNIISGYIPKDKNSSQIAQANYEKQYRKVQNIPQPTITNVTTRVDLYPSKNTYTIKGNYILKNKTQQPIHEILINFSDNFRIKKAVLYTQNGTTYITNQHQIIKLKKGLIPNQKISFTFELYYQWNPINGHQSFNAIVANGSFLRISRYYPQIGYQANEIEDENIRKKYQLGKPTPTKPLESSRVPNNDFISLDMIISTENNQTVIGVGELIKQWKEKNRNLFQYKIENIPFRFAVSSANYAIKKERYKEKSIEVYYHPTHYENVAHLIKNAKITIDYCETNFGKYPFKTIRFAEISAFTQGFNATAYPATIYMNENMSFHCNIAADKQQDVINELAGHELAHMWWGNNQINPDAREGDTMLTETLAMYTELMLLKKMYGKSKVEESVKMHQDIYQTEKGFSGNVPLIKVTNNLTHISYSKGAVAMYKLSMLIGEEKVNLALRNFLKKHKYPNPKPISTDFLIEIYTITNTKYHKKIKELFEK